MKLILTATEIASSAKLVTGVILQMPGETDWELIDKLRDPKDFLKKVVTSPKHGFTVTLPDCSTPANEEMIDAEDVAHLRLVIEVTEAEYLAINKLLSRHTGTIISLVKMYMSFVELIGSLMKTFVDDIGELTETTLKFGQDIEVEKADSGIDNADTPA